MDINEEDFKYSDSSSGDDSNQSDMNVTNKKKTALANAITENCSKFFFVQLKDIKKELNHEIDPDDLEDFSDDEIGSDIESSNLQEDNKAISCMHTNNINEQMTSMARTFSKLSHYMNNNLENMQQYIA